MSFKERTKLGEYRITKLMANNYGVIKPKEVPLHSRGSYIPPNANFNHLIYLGALDYETFFEETKHAVHSHVGFPSTLWDAAAKEDLKNNKVQDFLLKAGSKKDWWTNIIYETSPGAEMLLELDFIYFKLRTVKKMDEVDALRFITQEIPNCGPLFASYHLKENLLSRAYRENKPEEAEQIRQDKIQIDIGPFLSSTRSLEKTREQELKRPSEIE